MKVLVTGTAGFIGSFVALGLAKRGDDVLGIDNINSYYDVNLKYARLTRDGFDSEKAKTGVLLISSKYQDYKFRRIFIEDKASLNDVFEFGQFDIVCHLAAQAGVRHSITNPYDYIDSNVIAFMNIIECCRYRKVKHLIYASSSSVYGLNTKYPFSVNDRVGRPISIYAATKRMDELIAHVYSHLYGIHTTGLRFFTVYGPWGRPDMALFLFTKAILEGKPIDVYNNGEMKRDFTYIDDIVSGVLKVLDNSPHSNFNLYNIGNNAPVALMDFIEAIERATGKEAKKNFLQIQPGDVPITWADVDNLVRDFGYKPKTKVEDGVAEFVKWYLEYYGKG